jgi:hypothetical protein
MSEAKGKKDSDKDKKNLYEFNKTTEVRIHKTKQDS